MQRPLNVFDCYPGPTPKAESPAAAKTPLKQQLTKTAKLPAAEAPTPEAVPLGKVTTDPDVPVEALHNGLTPTQPGEELAQALDSVETNASREKAKNEDTRGERDIAQANTDKPKMPKDGGCAVAPLINSDGAERKRMFFGTMTNFGLGLKASAESANAAINLGFKRKEASLVPLADAFEREDKGDGEIFARVKFGEGGKPSISKTKEKYASTLAAIDMRIRAKCGSKELAGKNTDGACVSHFFATGGAADGLALDSEIRSVFGGDSNQALRGVRQ